MGNLLRISAAAVAFVAAAPLASAQTTVIQHSPGYVELSPAQRTVIYRRVVRERPVVVGPSVELRVGAPVPRAVELQTFPDEIYVEAPRLRRYRYFHVHNEVVLVDPETSEIVEIIRE